MMFESHDGSFYSNTDQASETIDISSSPTVSFTVGQNPHKRIASKVHRWNDQKTGVVTKNPQFQHSGMLTHTRCPLFDMMKSIDSPDKFIVLGVVKGSKPGDHQHLIAHDAESKGVHGVSRTKKNFIFPDPALLMVDVDFKDDFCEPAMQVITPDEAVQLLEKALDFSSVISMLSTLNTPRYLRAEHMVLQHLLDCKLLAPEAYTPAGASTADLIRELLNDAPKKEG